MPKASSGGGATGLVDMAPGRFAGERVTTARGQTFEWTGEAWLWISR
jgi:hypothetical protein